MRAAVLRNPRAHAHARGRRDAVADVALAEPATPLALREVLRAWAAAGVTRLVVDGGDGTVHHVLSQLPEAFDGRSPEVAVLASGKTNALARDLGLPRGWDVHAALRASGSATRAPVEVVRRDDAASVQRGFLMGAGAFTDAVASAQRLHAAGLFGGLAVGVALASASARALAGPASDPWRAGRLMRLDGEAEAARFLLLLSTLERLPLGLKPFGPVRPGLKLLDVAARPRRLLAALPPVLGGRERPWLAAAGYRRAVVEAVRLSTEAPFILDGELFDGGDLVVRQGAPVRFVVP